MITPKWLDEMSRSIEISGRLQDSVLKDVVRRLVKTNFTVTETAKWQVEKLQQAGMLYDEILDEVAKSTKQLKSEIKKIFDDAECEVFNYPDEVLEEAGYAPEKFKRLSPQMKAITAAAAAKAFTEAKNLVRTTASVSQNTFINACELAHEQIMSGSFSYTQAIANAIKQAALMSGYVRYPTGAKTTIEAATRRAVLTGVNQTTAQLQIMRADEFDCDLVEVTAHFGARPDHAEWQGQVYSRSGKDPDYDSFDICGYGTVEGLCGANCKHNFYPFFKGISKRNYTDEELDKMKNATVTVDGKEMPVYEALQKQRTLERSIRQDKAKLVGLSEAQKASGSTAYSADFDRAAARLKQKEEKLAAWCEKTGLTYESGRVRVYGFDRSAAQKAVQGNKRELERQNYLRNIKPTQPKVVKTNDTVLQSKLDYDIIYNGSNKQGIVPTGVDLTDVHIIAGYGSSVNIRVANDLEKLYGGASWKWEKKTGIAESAYGKYEIHWYEYQGKQYNSKLKRYKEK